MIYKYIIMAIEFFLCKNAPGIPFIAYLYSRSSLVILNRYQMLVINIHNILVKSVLVCILVMKYWEVEYTSLGQMTIAKV